MDQDPADAVKPWASLTGREKPRPAVILSWFPATRLTAAGQWQFQKEIIDELSLAGGTGKQ